MLVFGHPALKPPALCARAGPYLIRQLLQAKAPRTWRQRGRSNSSTSTQRPYSACVVMSWDLTPGATQQILQHLSDACKEITLTDHPCAGWSPDHVLRTEADCNAL